MILAKLGVFRIGVIFQDGFTGTSGSKPRRRKARKEKFSLGRLRGLRTQSKECRQHKEEKEDEEKRGCCNFCCTPIFCVFPLLFRYNLDLRVCRSDLRGSCLLKRLPIGSGVEIAATDCRRFWKSVLFPQGAPCPGARGYRTE